MRSLKIAYCYSGLYRTFAGWQENHVENLPAGDRYFSTWASEEPKVNIPEMRYFDPPKVDYNLYAGEFGKKYGEHLQHKERSRLYTATMQHLGHWFITQSLTDNYDVIVRLRYDIFLGKHKQSFFDLFERCYITNKSIGVGNCNSEDDRNVFMQDMPPIKYGTGKMHYMMDFITIHKPSAIKDVMKLHNEKNLWPTNTGWWQILSGNDDDHENYRGGVQLARYINKQVN